MPLRLSVYFCQSLLLLPLLGASSVGQAQSKPLESGKAVESELKGGETHTYSLNARPGQFVYVYTEQKGIDVVVTLLDAKNKQLKQVDGPTGSIGSERLSYIFESTGPYTIEVKSLEKEAPAGKYRTEIRELRPVSAGDKDFVNGEGAEYAAYALDVDATAETSRQVERSANEAMDLYLLVAKTSDPNERIAAALNELGNFFNIRSDYRKALVLYGEQLRILEAGEPTRSLGRVYNNIGLIFRRQGNSAIALVYLQKALSNWEKFDYKPGLKIVLNNLGLVQMDLGNYQASIEAYRRSAGAVSDEEITDPGALGNIGLVYSEQKEHQKAIRNLHRAFDLPGGQIGSIASGLAKVYLSAGRHMESLEWAKKAIALHQPSAAGDQANANTIASQASFRLGRPEESLSFAETAINFNEQMRAAGRAEERQELFESSLEPYHLKAEILAGQGKSIEALAVNERIRSRALLEVLRAGRENRRPSTEKDEKDRLAKLNAELVYLNAQIIAQRQKPTVDKAVLDALVLKQAAKRDERDALAARIADGRGQGPDLRIPGAEFRLASLSPLLDKDTAALEFMVGDNGTILLFVLTKGTNETVPAVRSIIINDLDNGKPIAETLNTFRHAVEKGDLRFASASKELYSRLIKPVEQELAGKSRVIIVPHAGLWDLPFQALMDHRGNYFFERASVSYAPSLTALTVMSRPRGRADHRLDLLAYGNPVIGKETAEKAREVFMSATLEPIPEAERLVNELGRMYGPGRSKIFTGSNAREETAKTEAPKYRIVQFATHGILNNASPMYSHLVLAQNDKNPNEDGLLEAWELKDLDLKADMVILSACDTARGRISAGEGIIGMTWASFIAGAPTTVASQWKVESRSTTELMLEFHRQLLKGNVSKAEALRRAQLKLLRDPKYRHPSYWAAWVIVGDGS